MTGLLERRAAAAAIFGETRLIFQCPPLRANALQLGASPSSRLRSSPEPLRGLTCRFRYRHIARDCEAGAQCPAPRADHGPSSSCHASTCVPLASPVEPPLQYNSCHGHRRRRNNCTSIYCRFDLLANRPVKLLFQDRHKSSDLPPKAKANSN